MGGSASVLGAALAPVTFGTSLALTQGAKKAGQLITPKPPQAGLPQQTPTASDDNEDEEIKRRARLGLINEQSLRQSFGTPQSVGRRRLLGN